MEKVTNLVEELRQIIAKVGKIDDPQRITDEADFFRDLGLDSMHALEIVLEMEARFGVELSDEPLGEIRTLADVVRLAKQLGLEGGS